MERESRILLLARPFSAQTGNPTSLGAKVAWRRLAFKPALDPDDVDVFPTRGLFLRLEDFLDLGGFHTRALPHYLSDYEFTLRAVRRGFRLHTDTGVRLLMDEATTGIRTKDYSSPLAYLRSLLTIKATGNPVYWTMFVLLASPPRYKPRNLWTVWRRFVVGLVRSFRMGGATQT